MPFNSVFAWFIGKRLNRIQFYRNSPIEAQQEVYSFLNKNLCNTSFFKETCSTSGKKKHSLDVLELQDYDSLKPYIDRALKGEQNVLWKGKTSWFAKSSGTTANNKKLLPVTEHSLRQNHYANGKDLLAQYYNNLPDRKLFNAKHLVIGGTGDITNTKNGIFIGDLSAIIINNLPWWTEWRRAPSKEIALQGDWEIKLENMAKAVQKENICIVAGMPSWTILLMEKVLSISGKKSLKEIWPNFELYIHGGMHIEPYEEKLRSLCGTLNVQFIESYNASEGYFGWQDQLQEKDLLLATYSGIYYEFIPMSTFQGRTSKTILKLHEITVGVEYALVISTSAGLWRYIIGDTITFTSLLPFRFKVTGRTSHFINAFGEKLIEIHAEKAIQKAATETNGLVANFTVAPTFFEDGKAGCHEWLIEFNSQPNSIPQFEKWVDIELKALNDDYNIKREKALNIGPPKFVYIGNNAFEKWLKSNGKLGGQHKIPRLSNNRIILEQILTFERT